MNFLLQGKTIDGKNLKYIILGTIITVHHTVVSVCNFFGLQLNSWIARLLGTAWLLGPIVALLFVVAKEKTYRKTT